MRISKISLGTAQLGQRYGIANKTGKPDLESVENILKTAIELGINTFDTAPAYGNSEEIIGKFIMKNIISQELVIITKIPSMEKSYGEKSFDAVYDTIRTMIKNSSSRLSLKTIPICLLHNPGDMKDKFVIESLIRLRNEGLVKKIGVSVYHPDEVKEFLNIESLDAIQVPINLFDTRLLTKGLIDELKKNKKIVFARSVFLQGLFFLDPNNLPQNLQIAKEPLMELQEISKEFGKSIQEIALNFVRDLDGITSVIIGVETINQLRNNIEIIDRPPMHDSLKQRMFKSFSDLPLELIDPSKWKSMELPR